MDQDGCQGLIWYATISGSDRTIQNERISVMRTWYSARSNFVDSICIYNFLFLVIRLDQISKAWWSILFFICVSLIESFILLIWMLWTNAIVLNELIYCKVVDAERQNMRRKTICQLIQRKNLKKAINIFLIFLFSTCLSYIFML